MPSCCNGCHTEGSTERQPGFLIPAAGDRRELAGSRQRESQTRRRKPATRRHVGARISRASARTACGRQAPHSNPQRLAAEQRVPVVRRRNSGLRPTAVRGWPAANTGTRPLCTALNYAQLTSRSAGLTRRATWTSRPLLSIVFVLPRQALTVTSLRTTGRLISATVLAT
jgi:hypothetical protein